MNKKNVINKKNLYTLLILGTFLVAGILKSFNILDWAGFGSSICFFALGLIPELINYIIKKKRDKKIKALQFFSAISSGIHEDIKNMNKVNSIREEHHIKKSPTAKIPAKVMNCMLRKDDTRIVKEVSKFKALYGNKYRDEIKSWDNDLKNMDQEYSNQLSKLKVTKEERKYYSLMDPPLKPNE